jgi:cyclophilin family peptidyl-prolyl cis-trans isomerase
MIVARTITLILAAALTAINGCQPAASQSSDPNTSRATKTERRTAFDRCFSRWKSLLSELRDLDLEYRTGSEREKETIEPRYNQLVAQGEEMQVELIDSAVLAYVESPTANHDLLVFLAGVMNSEMNANRYEAALRLAQLLIDNGVKHSDIFVVAGVAAFHSNQFDLAERHLQRAKEMKALQAIDTMKDTGTQCLEKIPYYSKAWEREERLRNEEAAGGDLPRVVLETTKGEMELELFEDQAPNTVANFIFLVEQGFYDGLDFHRVEAGALAQAGCPNGDGKGGPGYTIPCECPGPERRLHFRGSIAMAHSGRDTGGSQFYISFKPLRHLDGQHTVFGRVVRGLEVLSKLQPRIPRDPLQNQINPHRRHEVPPADKILKARVLRKRNHPYQPKGTPRR